MDRERAFVSFPTGLPHVEAGAAPLGRVRYGPVAGRSRVMASVSRCYLTTRLGNDDRDEDRGGPSGFEDKAARARRFAAEMALHSYALRAAAEGAVLAYAEVTGETWKAYQAPVSASASVGRRAASDCR